MLRPDMTQQFNDVNRRVLACERCERLIAHCRDVAAEKRAAYRDFDYWGKPVPNLGPADARLLIVGLAPGAHGANRTGRMFTGDKSGDFLFAALHAEGFASQPQATTRDDGLELIDCVITAAAHCAPPGNKPTALELNNCRTHLVDTIAAMPRLRGLLCLGGIAFDAALKVGRQLGWPIPKPKPRFGHGLVLEPGAGLPFIASAYHVSQQNTFTGRLTMAMFRQVLADVRARLDA